MILIIRVVCVALLLSAFSARAVAEEFTNAIRVYLQQAVDAVTINGCMVVGLVDEHGTKVIGYGKLDNGTDQEANGETLFAVHSATGTFTRLALQDMVERGNMRLDDPVAMYLPTSVKMPTRNGREITLRQLAAESSGLANFEDKLNPKRGDDALGDYTVEKMDAFVSESQLASDPGTTHAHGGVDLALLGQAIALKAGTDYESFMAECVFRPLQMNNSQFTLTPELKSRLAKEHDDWGYSYAIPRWNWGALKPVAGLYSTVNDLLKFASANLGLPQAGSTPLIQNSAVNFPYAPQGGGIIHTGGGGLGGGAYIGFDMVRRRAVVILSTAYIVRRDLGYFLLESEWQSDRRPAETNVNHQLYESYVGQYRLVSHLATWLKPWKFSHHEDEDASLPGIGIRCDKDHLFAQAIGAKTLPSDELLPPVMSELLPESKTSFFERLSGLPVVFSANARRQKTRLTLERHGKALVYEKISDHPPKASEPAKPRVVIELNPKILDAFAGSYEFATNAVFPTGLKLNIWREGDKLEAQGRGEKFIKGVFDLYAGSETNFFDRYLYGQYNFVKNRGGEITGVIYHQLDQADCIGKKASAAAQ